MLSPSPLSRATIFIAHHEVRDGREGHRHEEAHGDVDEEVAHGVRENAVSTAAVLTRVDGALLQENRKSLQGGEEEQRQP